MTPHPQFSDLKAIEDYIYSSMNHTPEWRKAEEAFQRILSASHTPAKSEQCPHWMIARVAGIDGDTNEYFCNAKPSEREQVIKELRDFDMWFSGRHVCGQSPIIAEVRQEIHRRIEELRKQGEPR